MKNVLLIINVVLLGLVGYLYYLQFGNRAPVKKQAVTETQKDSLQDKVKIAYIDLDSLQENYIYYKRIKSELESKQKSANNELTSMQKKFQTRAMALQQKAQTMTPPEQEKAMTEMNSMQGDLQARQQTIESELYEYNAKMKDDILARIQNFLKTYNKDARYSYIFSYEPGFMFYKDSTLDITNDVIKGLNDLYASEKK